MFEHREDHTANSSKNLLEKKWLLLVPLHAKDIEWLFMKYTAIIYHLFEGHHYVLWKLHVFEHPLKFTCETTPAFCTKR